MFKESLLMNNAYQSDSVDQLMVPQLQVGWLVDWFVSLGTGRTCKCLRIKTIKKG